MAPEQGPASKDVSSGKQRTSTTNEFGTGQEHRYDSLNQSTLQTDSLSWIYLLRKDRLIEVCRDQGIPISEGATVDHLRRQLSELIKVKRQRASSENLLRSLEEELLVEEKSSAITEQALTTIRVEENRSPVSPTDADVMNIIRRWELVYEGGDNLVEFLERLEELADCYGINLDRVLFSLLEILRGKALQWYRIKREHIHSWSEFKNEASHFFLPKRYLAHLEESIYHRKQGPREKAKDYIMAIQTLIRQHPILRTQDHTDRIYDGLRCEYKLYVRRNDFQNIDELMEWTDEFEYLKNGEAKQNRIQPSHYMSTQSVSCWNCRQIGHMRRQCPNPQRSPNMSHPESHNQFSDGRYYIDVHICGHPIRALVDTGSTLSYIGEEVQKVLEEHRIRPRKQQQNVQLANRSCAKSVNTYPVSIQFGGKSTKLLVSALDHLAEPLILGMDFLHRRQAKLFIDGVELKAKSCAVEENEEEIQYKGKLKQAHIISLKMERKATRPIAPGKIISHLRQTRMPRHVPAYMPPFEARPRIVTVQNSPIAQSGNAEVDALARQVWERKHKLYSMRNEPPPLVRITAAKPGTSTSFPNMPDLNPTEGTIKKSSRNDTPHSSLDGPPPLVPISTPPSPSVLVPPITPELTPALEEIRDEDVLSLDTSQISEDENDEAEDLFRDIKITDDGSKRDRAWTIFPKGRPKIQVRIKGGIVYLRCQGRSKIFKLDE